MRLFSPERSDLGQPGQTLYYVMDPMCSWCWAFAPVLERIEKKLHTNRSLVTVMGGLAPESDQPMPEAMRTQIASVWRQIEQKTGRPFNHAFWQRQQPRRSTYPACKAVITAEQIRPGAATAMINAIQNAYYCEAQNPSLYPVLVELAAKQGFERSEFEQQLQSSCVDQLLNAHLALRDQLYVQGYPSLVLWQKSDSQIGVAIPVQNGYCDENKLVKQLNKLELLREI